MSEGRAVTAQSDFCTVIDGLLEPEAFDRLWNHLQEESFQRVAAMGLSGTWPLEDGDVLRGPTVGWGHLWQAQYPTRTPMDAVMKALVDSAELFVSSVGRYGVDWEVFSAMSTLYRAGQGLYWHRDSEDNAGSWIYYAHPEWNIEWGGELLLSHARDIPREYGACFHRLLALPGLPDPPPWQSHLDNDDASRLLLAEGFGSLVMPKPNRLVVIKGGTPHTIAKVNTSAGSHVRATIGGFIKKKSVRLDLPPTRWTR
jgi:Rps23 Pro-64 3,4-dihydroxylase Tpa1-like proline 4-hydroxylase